MPRRNTQQEDAVLQNLQEIKEIITRHTESDERNFKELRVLFDGGNDHPGINIRLDRIEQLAASRSRALGYLWAAVAALAGGAVLKLWLG